MTEKIQIIINPEAEEWFNHSGHCAEGTNLRQRIERIVAEGMQPGSELIYDGGRNRLWVDGGNLNVKAFGLPMFPNSLIYSHFRKSKARRSYEHALRLLSLGFDTPMPVGYAEVRVGYPSLLRRSFYFSMQMAYPNMRFWETVQPHRQLTRQWAFEIARLHASGVWIKDHSAGNILRSREENGDFHFSYVDLNRIRFNVINNRKLMKMFKSVSTSLDFTLELARDYADITGKDPAAVERQVSRIFRRFNRYKH